VQFRNAHAGRPLHSQQVFSLRRSVWRLFC
jgi:hypothetical protein